MPLQGALEGHPQSSPPKSGPRASILPFLADHHLPYMVPVIVYWIISFVFHYIDTRGLLLKYKLHTPAEDLTKNRATKKDVIKFALFQQACQCTLGYLTAGADQSISHEYAIAAWVQTIRYSGILATQLMRYAGVETSGVMNECKGYGTSYAAAFTQDTLSSNGSSFSQTIEAPNAIGTIPFTPSEINAARAVYWILVPLLQYISVMILADTFQYFTHRAFHVNKWLYKHIHAMHHEIYVPFAYGAFYNHPLETIPIDMIGFPICLAIAGLDNRQSAFFGAIWTFKTVVDHCGYDFPYNPCNIVCPHSVLFHDLHHQTWGMKYNFSVYGNFWDWLMGTKWSPHDAKAQEKYKRGKATAETVATKQNEILSTTTGDSTAVEL